MADEPEVVVLNRQRRHRVSRLGLERFLRRVAAALPGAGRRGSVAVCLVSDRRMRELNRDYRDQDRPTDVLSFPMDDGPAPDGQRHLGDIVVAVPTAARQAAERGHSLARELRVLCLHGYLHLLGYDHETDGGTMMRLQRRLERGLLPVAGAAR